MSDWTVLARAGQAALLVAALLVTIRGVKFPRSPPGGLLPPADALVAASLGLAMAAAEGSWLFHLPLLLLAGALLLALWLDALLFRVFNIELGPGGVRSIVLSALARELGEIAWARRFLSANLAFALLPLALVPLLAYGAMPRASELFTLLGVLIWLLLALREARAGPLGLALLVANGAALASSVGLTLAAAALLPAWPALYAFWSTRREEPLLGLGPGRPSTVLDFLLPRPLPVYPGWRPRPEHEALLALAPEPPPPSPQRGALSGADVVLITFESLGRDHLAAYARGGAEAPFLTGMLERSVSSANHFCLSPTTNNAHAVLYTSRYAEAGGPGGVSALRAAGYQAIYLTTARVQHYGLRAILEASGFERVIDRETMGGGVALSDHALLDGGLSALAGARDGRPLFLHVHMTDAHVPYRVTDPRFQRRGKKDRGRFLDAIEEADHIVRELARRLARRGLARDPLLLLTSDHGQGFGELGYRSHGSAVTSAQVNTPFLVHHPRLAPGSVRWSSHLDVLPTALDLLGLDARAGFGRSIFNPARPPWLVLWAGHPSRTTTSNWGAILGEQKAMIDLVTDECWLMDWNDAGARRLEGQERVYTAALLTAGFARLGLR